MRPITIIFLFILHAAYSQNEIDFGRIKEDTSFCSRYSKNYLRSSKHQLPQICNSSHLLEIRLSTFHELLGSGTATEITYDSSGVWHASSSTINYQYLDTNNLPRIEDFKELKPVTDYNSLFDQLKKSHIFLIADQSELQIEDPISDGTTYTVFFKTGDKYGHYSFRNPVDLVKYNRYSSDLKNFVEIIQIIEKNLVPK